MNFPPEIRNIEGRSKNEKFDDLYYEILKIGKARVNTGLNFGELKDILFQPPK